MQLVNHVIDQGFADASLLDYLTPVADAAETLAGLKAHFC